VAGRPDGGARVARVLAGDGEPAGADAPAPAAAAAAEEPAQPRWRDDTAYLAPQLAFNLGVPYQLAPFLPRAAAAPGAAGGERGRCAVTVEALLPPSADAPPGEGRPARGFAQRPGLAAGVTVACLAEPDASVLRRGGGARDPADPAAAPADGDAAEPAPAPGAEAAGEQLVAALRRHFSDAPRREPPRASPPATPACLLTHPPGHMSSSPWTCGAGCWPRATCLRPRQRMRRGSVTCCAPCSARATLARGRPPGCATSGWCTCSRARAAACSLTAATRPSRWRSAASARPAFL
jgi:hypothetical protein